MAYADLASVQATDPGDPLTAAWCDQARDNDEFFIDPPACSVYASAVQSVGSGAGVTLTANTENFDNDSMHSTVSNTSRITAQTAGRYLVIATIQYASNATGNRSASLLLNGTTILEGELTGASNGNSTIKTVARAVVLAASDYVEARAFQTSGGNLNTTLLEFVAIFLTRS